MDNSKDLLIWVTGLVGRSMGSGKFDASHIGMLTENAVAAFEEHLAPKLAHSQPAPSRAPSAPQAAQRAAAPQGGSDIPAETKNFNLWAGDNAYIYGQDGKTWADLMGAAQEGDDAARAALEKQAKAGLGKDPKWHSANAKRIGRAKACVAMLRNGGSAGDEIPY